MATCVTWNYHTSLSWPSSTHFPVILSLYIYLALFMLCFLFHFLCLPLILLLSPHSLRFHLASPSIHLKYCISPACSLLSCNFCTVQLLHPCIWDSGLLMPLHYRILFLFLYSVLFTTLLFPLQWPLAWLMFMVDFYPDLVSLTCYYCTVFILYIRLLPHFEVLP